MSGVRGFACTDERGGEGGENLNYSNPGSHPFSGWLRCALLTSAEAEVRARGLRESGGEGSIEFASFPEGPVPSVRYAWEEEQIVHEEEEE